MDKETNNLEQWIINSEINTSTDWNQSNLIQDWVWLVVDWSFQIWLEKAISKIQEIDIPIDFF